MVKALTVGGATIDVIGLVASTEIERMTMHNATTSFLLLEEGKKIDASGITSSVGGGASNAAVAMARMGAQTACFGLVGQDLDGDEILQVLTCENVEIDLMLRHDDLPTGKAVMIASHVRNPTIFVARGANTALKQRDITPEVFKDRDLVYITGLSGDSAACFAEIAAQAKAAGAFVAANPGIRQITYRTESVLEALQYIDLLTLNRTEAEALVKLLPYYNVPKWDMPQVQPLLFEEGLCGRPLQSYMAAVLEAGPKIAVVTNGREGAYIGSADGIRYGRSLTTSVKGTAGAGDAFASTFALQWVMKQDLKLAFQAAVINAAAVVQELDTQSGLMTESEIDIAIHGQAPELLHWQGPWHNISGT